MYYVYELVDPRTDETGYIGITNNPSFRYMQHLEGKDRNERKNAWLQQILAAGYDPEMRILETVGSEKQAREREIYWIQYLLQQGVSLTNIRGTSHRNVKIQQLREYYTESQAEKILGVDHVIFSGLRHQGTITPAFLRGKRRRYYLKSDVDELAKDLGRFRRIHGSELNRHWFRK